jgi:mono/diheme cytochrome c family protein
MGLWGTTVLGLLFLGLAVVATYSMFQFWGYPFDKEKRRSECPQWKMNIHRAIGFAYVIVYVILMIKMVPRLWTYQVELPPRTVAHIMLGVSIGVLLIIKISILRFFRHFEEWMPALGVGLLLCTVLLIVLSVPFVLKERALASDNAFSDDNRARVATLLESVGFPEGTDVSALATEQSLRRGRQLLLADCVYCHDLRTAIARPRTPKDWYRTVERMRTKPTLGRSISVDDGHLVTAYLVAITPKLQDSAKAERVARLEKVETKKAADDVMTEDTPPPAPADDAGAGEAGDGGAAPTPAPTPAKSVDLAKAKTAYEEQCSQCHELSDVDDAPPTSRAETDELIQRMIDNGMEVDAADIELIRAYLNTTFVKK